MSVRQGLSSLWGAEERVEIQLSPLIDMMFLLLIFFLVAAVFVEQSGIEVQRPLAATAQPLRAASVYLSVTADGRVLYGDRNVGINGVRGLVSRLMESDKRSVVLVADRRSSSGTLIEVLDECRAAGATEISVAAEKR
ncbi:MAG: biopolymer transporter ExbD [Candidatus Omnitrophica bacterium]|nr:biopolymer transporter ExbD [Candidatus Omnitrophota bacterium]